MLLFLNYVLAKVDSMNIEFQSQQFRLHNVFSTISDEYRGLLSMFISNDAMNSKALSSIDPADHGLYKDLYSMDLGGRCEAMLLRQPLGIHEKRFRSDVQAFLRELCLQIRMRFPLAEDSVIAQLKVMDASEAMSTHASRVRSIVNLASHFPTLVADDQLDDLQDQWRALLSAICHLQHAKNMPPTSFWLETQTIKDGLGRKKFGLLGKFLCDLLVLPHPSACVERIFSQVNIVKSELTNRLQTETVANRLLAKQAIHRQNAVCHTWKPSQSLIEDVQFGRCHQRYTDHLKSENLQCSITHHGIDEDDCV